MIKDPKIQKDTQVNPELKKIAKNNWYDE